MKWGFQKFCHRILEAFIKLLAGTRWKAIICFGSRGLHSKVKHWLSGRYGESQRMFTTKCIRRSLQLSLKDIPNPEEVHVGRNALAGLMYAYRIWIQIKNNWRKKVQDSLLNTFWILWILRNCLKFTKYLCITVCSFSLLDYLERKSSSFICDF